MEKFLNPSTKGKIKADQKLSGVEDRKKLAANGCEGYFWGNENVLN